MCYWLFLGYRRVRSALEWMTAGYCISSENINLLSIFFESRWLVIQRGILPLVYYDLRLTPQAHGFKMIFIFFQTRSICLGWEEEHWLKYQSLHAINTLWTVDCKADTWAWDSVLFCASRYRAERRIPGGIIANDSVSVYAIYIVLNFPSNIMNGDVRLMDMTMPDDTWSKPDMSTSHLG